MVLEFGLESGLRGISLADAIERADVPRTSAYRAFSDGDRDPQDTFRQAVLLESVRRTDVDTSMVATVFAGLASSTFDNTPAGQAAEFRELIRQWSGAALESNRANDQLRAVEAITQVTALSRHPEPEVVEALMASFAQSHAEFEPLYQITVDRYGLRFRPGFDVAYLTSSLRAVAGMAITEWEIELKTRTVTRPTGHGGADQEWTLTGVIAEAIALLILEPDPNAEGIAADLSTWIG